MELAGSWYGVSLLSVRSSASIELCNLSVKVYAKDIIMMYYLCLHYLMKEIKMNSCQFLTNNRYNLSVKNKNFSTFNV